MQRNVALLWFCTLLLIVASSYAPEAQAALPALAKKSTVLYSQPSLQANPIGRLPQITKVSVLGKSGTQWFKIRVTLRDGRTLEGWTLKSNLFQPQESSPASSPPRKSSERSLVDSLLDGGKRPSSDEKRNEDKPSKKVSKPAAVKKYREADDGEGSALLTNRLVLGTFLGYRVNSYSVSDASNTISYDIPGLFFGVQGDYDFLKLENLPLIFGIHASFSYELKNYTIELLDDATTPTQISSTDASGTTQDIDLALRAKYAFSDSPTTTQLMLQIGYLLSSSSLDDGTFHNLPINLFTSNEYSHVYGGIIFRVPFEIADTLAGFQLDGKYFLLNDFSESVSGGTSSVSGQISSAAPGFAAEASVFWRFTEHLVSEITFTHKVEGADFTGTGERISNTSQAISFTNANVSDTWSGGQLSVKYAF